LYKTFIKRSLDIIFALVLLPFVLIIITICGIMIKLEDRGTVFYFSTRLGKNRKLFKMIKLRTMKLNAPDIRNEDGSTYNSEDDLRLTKIGKFLRKTSLDELPQIFNVLIGNMSFIGPRPDLTDQIIYYSKNDFKKLKVLPGISGYNQAYFRNSLNWKNKIENDIFYVEHLTFLLDFKIFFKTIKMIFLSRGIYIKNINSESRKKEYVQSNSSEQ